MAGVRGGSFIPLFSHIALNEPSQKTYTGPLKRSNCVQINPGFVLCHSCRQAIAPSRNTHKLLLLFRWP